MNLRATFGSLLLLACGLAAAVPFARRPAASDDARSVAPAAPAEPSPSVEQVAKPATVAIPVAEIRTPSLSAIEMIPTEERPVVPPLIQLPEWTNDPARIITWDAPPLPPENPYEQAARANQRSGTIAEPVRVPVSVHAPQRVRRHRVVDGDSWRLLSLRYYGDEEHMELLQQANRGLLTDPELLPVGVAIEIPQQ